MFKNKSKKEEPETEMNGLMKAQFDVMEEETLEGKYRTQINKIKIMVSGCGAIRTGMAFSLSSKSQELAKVDYLSALYEQNWIIMKQQEEMIRLLKKVCVDSKE